MGCCEFIMKAILIVINAIVILNGVALLVTGGIFISGAHDYFEVESLQEYSSDITPVAIPLMVVGGILLVVGLIGCCGAFSGKSGLLNIYIIVVIIVILVELAVAIFCVIKKDSIRDLSVEAGEAIMESEQMNRDTPNTNTTAINSIQYFMGCCGTYGKSFWGNDTVGAKVTPVWPSSCCSEFDSDNMDVWTFVSSCTGEVYEKGCSVAFQENFNNIGLAVGIVMAAIIIFEIFCVIAACCSKKNDMVA